MGCAATALLASSRFSVRLIDFLFALIGFPHRDNSGDSALLGRF